MTRLGSVSKYHNQKTMYDGVLFDSKREAERWAELLILEKAGVISDLKRQVRYELLPTQKTKTKTERAVNYVADFVYKENGETVVEDTKGVPTKEYIIKRKLMLFIHGIEIREV